MGLLGQFGHGENQLRDRNTFLHGEVGTGDLPSSSVMTGLIYYFFINGLEQRAGTFTADPKLLE